MPKLTKPTDIISKYFSNIMSVLIVINVLLATVALLRDVFFASYLGTSIQADALLLAFFIPDTIGNNLLAASVGVACIPVFSRLFVHGRYEELYLTIKRLTIAFLVISLVILLFVVFGSETIINKLGSGMSTESKSLSIKLLLIISPTIIIFPFYTVGSSVMHVFNRFIIPAFAPVLFNSIFLASVLYCMLFSIPFAKGVYLIAVIITIAVLTMALLVWLPLLFSSSFPGLKMKKTKRITADEVMDVKEIFLTFISYLLIILSTQSVLFAERYLASHLETGTIAALNYAFRIAQFPVWVFVAAVSVVVFPSMAKSSGLGKKEELHTTMVKAIWLVFLITIPLTVIIYILRIPITSILLQRGAFDNNSLEITAGILAGYSLTIIGQGMLAIGLRFFLALGQIIQPLVALLISACITIAADFYLVARFGSPGLGYGAAMGSIINAAIVYLLLKKEMRLNTLKNINQILRVIVACIPLIICVLVFNKLWYLFIPDTLFMKGAYAAAVAISSFVVYLIGLCCFKIV